MVILSRARLYRAVAIFVFVMGSLFGFFGVSLIIAGGTGSGSAGSKILLICSGVFLLVVAPVVVIFGVIAWQTSKSV
jgi:hypothetical protein